MHFVIHTLEMTRSTNEDARGGRPGDVFVAREQTAGRGRLDHRWVSEPGANLLMSVVLDVAGLDPAMVATLPLAVGLAVRGAVASVVSAERAVMVKWPNDVLVDGRKIAGILCERHEDNVIVGIGVNVLQTDFPSDLAIRVTSVACEGSNIRDRAVEIMRDKVLAELNAVYAVWRAGGFAALHASFAAADALKGRYVSVRQTDGDPAPVGGICGGVLPDGMLDVGGIPIPAGEAHVERNFPA